MFQYARPHGGDFHTVLQDLLLTGTISDVSSLIYIPEGIISKAKPEWQKLKEKGIFIYHKVYVGVWVTTDTWHLYFFLAIC